MIPVVACKQSWSHVGELSFRSIAPPHFRYSCKVVLEYSFTKCLICTIKFDNFVKFLFYYGLLHIKKTSHKNNTGAQENDIVQRKFSYVPCPLSLKFWVNECSVVGFRRVSSSFTVKDVTSEVFRHDWHLIHLKC